MMTSIFSSFDLYMLPSANYLHSIFYAIIPTIMFLQFLWVYPPSHMIYLFFIVNISSMLTKPTLSNHLKGFLTSLAPMFYSIVIMNGWGATPFIVPMSAHLMVTLSLGSCVWLSLMSTGVTTKFKSTPAHFLPENTPLSMASFLSLVEGLSSYIRPITLSFRLAANISAGHVILGMMTTAASSMSQNATMLIILAPMAISGAYSMFELMICLVQAFVFILLSAMYSTDYILK